jgi:hypothetical protein
MKVCRLHRAAVQERVADGQQLAWDATRTHQLRGVTRILGCDGVRIARGLRDAA